MSRLSPVQKLLACRLVAGSAAVLSGAVRCGAVASSWVVLAKVVQSDSNFSASVRQYIDRHRKHRQLRQTKTRLAAICGHGDISWSCIATEDAEASKQASRRVTGRLLLDAVLASCLSISACLSVEVVSKIDGQAP
ncbi:hypothetical protein B0T22DRAFT_38348 [Podospora appendiculata]|uniref:Uncharacterized protein n=1 Tax=Podospora appendiculata TaxID=314037 RepID=A0AAE0XH12_9PEZI|nr:hypothetical protein B0T22DRAFT_38348 [Podospora appendiculata]